jgi:small subunit ribosomal protein S4
LVLHKHILVNGDIVNIPSYSLKSGDTVSVRERSKSLEVVVNSLTSNRSQKYPWLDWNSAEMSGKMMMVPEREEIPENIQEQLIVELYSK